MPSLRLFWELTKRSFQRQLTYRAATLAGLATNFFFGIIRAAILIALYDTRQNVAGITLQGAITYAALFYLRHPGRFFELLPGHLLPG